jgi:hypothetical protein
MRTIGAHAPQQLTKTKIELKVSHQRNSAFSCLSFCKTISETALAPYDTLGTIIAIKIAKIYTFNSIHFYFSKLWHNLAWGGRPRITAAKNMPNVRDAYRRERAPCHGQLKKLSTSNFYAAGTASSEARRLRNGPCSFSNTTSDTEGIPPQRKFAEQLGLHLHIRVSVKERFEAPNLGAAGEATSVCNRTPDKKWSLVLSTEALDQEKPSHKGNIAAQSPLARGERVLWCNARNKGVKKRVRAALLRNHARTRASYVEPFSSLHSRRSGRRPRPLASPSLLEKSSNCEICQIHLFTLKHITNLFTLLSRT